MHKGRHHDDIYSAEDCGLDIYCYDNINLLISIQYLKWKVKFWKPDLLWISLLCNFVQLKSSLRISNHGHI